MEAAQFSDFGDRSHLGLLAKIMKLTQKARLDAMGGDNLNSAFLLDATYLSRYK